MKLFAEVMKLRQISLEELRRTEIEILDVVTKFCDEHDIKYCIAYGTLLGAIRHKGFIPWDDDIDLVMLRPDYDRFLKLFNENSTRYQAHSIENDPNFYKPFAKVMNTDTVLYDHGKKGVKSSISIDVFPYDNAPDDDMAIKKMFARRDFHVGNNFRRAFDIFLIPPLGNVFRRFCVYSLRIAFRVFPKYYFVRKIVENARLCISEDTKRVACFAGYYDAVFDRNMFNDLIYVEFEGKNYKAPAAYDKYLRAVYGDYMQLPPVEKRLAHNFTAYKR